VSTGRVQAEVVAPVPWFPFRGSQFGAYGAIARTPSEETRFGLYVHHPRYFMLPKVGANLHPISLAWSARRKIEKLIKKGLSFDVIDAHYFYPDGVAAAFLARHFDRPFIVTARGSDINLIAHLDGPRQMILDAANRAHALIAVSRALATAMTDLGIDSKRIVVLRNGVDCSLFQPLDRTTARLELGITAGPVLAAVGNLVPEKGHDLIIKALPALPDAQLVLVGDGTERRRLETLAAQLGVERRFRLLAPMPQERLSALYNAADVLVLASSREGWPNVLLESMACGTPVVATDVGGVREIVSAPLVGEVVSERSSNAIAGAVGRILHSPPDRHAIRLHAEQFGWDAVSRGQLELLQPLCAYPLA